MLQNFCTRLYESATNRIASKLLGSTSDGQVFRTEYDYSAGLITQERRYTDASTAMTTSYTYTPQGDVLTATDPIGNTLQYEYDANGFMARVFDTNNPSRQTLFSYDTLGNRASVTDANTKTTGFAYDNLQRVTSATNALGEQTVNTYTGRNLTQVETGRTASLSGLITRMYYDSLNRQERVNRVTSTGEVTLNTLRYDSEANVLAAIDANNLATTSSYDRLSRPVTTSDPLGNTTSNIFDKAGNVIQSTDANTNTTMQTYSTLNRLKTVTQNDGTRNIATQYTYDAVGNVRTVTDAEGRVTTHTYDGAGRLLTIQSPLGQTAAFEYDANGNITRRTDPDGRITEYDYNAYNELTAVYYGGRIAPVKTVTFTYDNAGNMLTWDDGTQSASYTYDGLNRVNSVTTNYPFGSKTISYTYDRFGNRQTATYPDGPGPLNYSYDDFNRLTAINYSPFTINYTYDPAGRLTSKTLPNGVTTAYAYDNASRLTSLANRRSDASVISAFSYTHDNVGNRLSMTEVSGSHNYSYDNVYRLTSAAHPTASTETYSYDRVGNRLTDAANTDWTYDANNRLQSYDGITFAYDNAGNTTGKSDGAGVTGYVYDYENRLTTATVGSLVVTYIYDPFGKRLSKTVGGATTYYLYDEEDIIAEYDSSGTLLASYIHGQGIDEPVSMTRGGNTYFYTMDGLGSVRDLTDSTQTIVEQYQYDSFGNLTTPPTTGNPYTYTSREYDAETGLLFYRARYYDPKVGRFLTEDPIGFEGGDINFYAYVYSNPINRIDSFGLMGSLPNTPGEFLCEAECTTVCQSVPFWVRPACKKECKKACGDPLGCNIIIFRDENGGCRSCQQCPGQREPICEQVVCPPDLACKR